MARKKEEFEKQIYTKPLHFDDQPGCQADKDLEQAELNAFNAAGTAAFEPTAYAAASCQNAQTESTSTPGISYSESDPGGQTHTRWYYGFRIARALIISGTIIYTIHRGLFEF